MPGPQAHRKSPRWWLLAVVVTAGTSPLAAGDAVRGDSEAPAGLKFFESDVRPILERHCIKCHGGEKTESSFSLLGRDRILEGGDRGPAVDLADPSKSVLLDAVNYGDLEMPPTGKISPAEIAALTRWVEQGLPMPADFQPAHPGMPPPEVNAETKAHWSFQPVVRPEPPAVQQPGWIANPIDAFILSKLEAAGLSPAPEADPRTLYRRLHYDLLGLPPSPHDVETFSTAYAQDPENTWKQAIDVLLDSPHYGEHWARYWLDLVRYAESNSFERDNPKPFVWRYRDYVIRSLNDDKPYTTFLREQLAGDELDEVTRDTIVATGYYRLGIWDDEPADAELAFYDGLDDIAATTSQAFLGLTMNCARCHDHKLDPLPQRDYYRFLAFFRNIRHYGQRSDESVQQASVRSIMSPDEVKAYATERRAWDKRVKELRTALDKVESRIAPQLSGGEFDDFKRDSHRLEIIRKHVNELITQDEFTEYDHARKEWEAKKENPPRSLALCVKEEGQKPQPTFILERGNPQTKGEEVSCGYPTVLDDRAPRVTPPASGESTGRRRALADWIAGEGNPLTSRVMVNRLWQWHFGRGLVRSSSNFGLQGDRPTHPELLDWLASEFVQRGWSLKEMHRLMLGSRAYRMTSRTVDDATDDGRWTVDDDERVADDSSASSDTPSPLTPHHSPSPTVHRPSSTVQPSSLDPTNNLYWHFDPRRLRAEEIRDSILTVNGTLNLAKLYGPSIYPTIPDEVLAGQSRPGAGWDTSNQEDQRRRSIYIHIKRSLQVPILAAFDVAETDFTCPERFATTQPTQALELLNSEFLNKQAAILAESVHQAAGDDLRAQLSEVLRRVTQRPPREEEIVRGERLIEELQREYFLEPAEALKSFCLVALNLNEFVYLD